MSEVNFFSEDIDFVIKDEDKATSWLNLLVQKHLKELGEINFIFCSDDYLHQLNVEFLQHDTFTDIITFPYEEATQLSGDIFISIERIKENAEELQIHQDVELRRVMAHGILHLCGFKDKTEEDQKNMRLQEDHALKLWNEKS